jgi:uncharacterized membrane protein
MLGATLGFYGMSEILNLHPVFVHFPLALLLTATFFYILGAALKKEPLLVVGKWNLFAGLLGSALAVWTGLEAAKGVSHGGGTHQVMILHQNLGYAILGLSLILSVWVLASKANIPSKLKGLFLAGLLILGVLIAQTADLGGRMVFLNGVGVGRKSMMPKEPGRAHVEHDHDAHKH